MIDPTRLHCCYSLALRFTGHFIYLLRKQSVLETKTTICCLVKLKREKRVDIQRSSSLRTLCLHGPLTSGTDIVNTENIILHLTT